MNFRIHVGYTSSGKDRWKYFETLELAISAANVMFIKTGIAVSVEKVK